MASPPRIAPSARYTSQSATRCYFLTTITAATFIPTRAELDSGTDLSPEVADGAGWTVTGNTIPVLDLSSRFEKQIAGSITAAPSTITFYLDKSGVDARVIMGSGTTGFIVFMDGGDVPANKMSIYPITVISNSAERSMQGTDADRVVVSYAITRPPAEHIPVPSLSSGPWSVPFLNRTPSGAITITGQSNVMISGKQFDGIGSDISAIRITNCDNVVITGNDFKDCCQPITVYNSTNVEISWCRYQNITGPHDRNGSNRANFTQWVSTLGGWIHDNKGIGGDTEDIISIYQSGGVDAAHPLIIERNSFEGTNWTSPSGSGIMTGDAGGSHIVVRNNTLLNPGQVGIGIASGIDINVTDNTVYGEQRPLSNVGIYVWNQAPGTCSGHTVARNRVSWLKYDGTVNPAFNAENCGPVTGWVDDNDWLATIDPATLHVTL